MQINLPLDQGIYLPASIPVFTPSNIQGVIQKQIGVATLSREKDGSVYADVDITDLAYAHMNNDTTHSLSVSVRQRPIVDAGSVVLLEVPIEHVSDIPIYEENEETGVIELLIPMTDHGRLRFRHEIFEDENVDATVDRVIDALTHIQFLNRTWSYSLDRNHTETVISWHATEGTI